MDPERWRNIERFYQSIVERSPVERAALLAQADPDIRAEVETLLAQPGGGALLDQHAADLLGESSLTQLPAGVQLGHYQIVAMLGKGGMGVVYRAKDTKLGREVAIKVLPDSLAQDPDRLARFNREAKVLASLNHPNIGHIYGVESQALVMELVEGETLASLLKSDPLPIETALNYARQIAEALEAAHEKAIIHRDLKPANIMVTPSGLVKVLDFGLAKTEEPAAGGDPAESPTAISPTRSGVILGTAAYMSPEQASGKVADRRADIWAFGVVLFETLTGRRAFPGESVTEILAGVLRGEPDWSALPSATPLGIRKLLRRCLERDRKQRLQAIGEARIEIEAALAEKSAFVSIIRRQKKVAAGSVIAMAAMAALTWFLLHRPSVPSAVLTQTRLTFNSSENPVQSAAISPDGRYTAYSDPTGIHVTLLATSEERLIPRPAGIPDAAYWLVDSWFPDGTQLLAHVDEPGGHKSMWTVSLVGQSPRHLRDDAEGFGVSPDGTQIAFGPSGTRDYVREIWVMGIFGDNPQRILAVGAHEWLQWVHWSPDGKRLAYIKSLGSSNRPQTALETCDLRGKRVTVVVPVNLVLNDFCWLPEGRIIYAQDGNLWQIGIDNHAGTPTGKPKSITQWAGSDLSALSASADGKRLVLLKQTEQGQIYLSEFAAAITPTMGPRRLTNDEADDFATAWTADSKAVLFTSARNGISGIYRQGISEETSEPVFVGTRDAISPRPSSDGAWVLFVESPKASTPPFSADRMMRIGASGGLPQFVLETRNWMNHACARAPATPCVIFETSQDRRQILITAFDPLKGRGNVLRTIEVDPTDPSDADYQSTLSPDGLTFAISRIGEAKIQIRFLSLSGGSDREITVTGGWANMTNLDWSANENALFCGSQSSRSSTLLHVDLKGNARVLWQHEGGRGLAGIPSPDGRYVAINTSVTSGNVWIVGSF
jgi:eukaryotic-like serine/threonine-protein kinase